MWPLLVVMLAAPCVAQERAATPVLSTMELLDATADFSFAIMSDHKGNAPSDTPRMARMVEWIRTSGDRFVIGLGDHLKIPPERSKPFLDFLAQDAWWHRRFWPNIADGENEFYGNGQDDWGAGGALLDAVEMRSRPGVAVRDNNCEYYARLFARGFTIHLIQLHFSDNPADISVAFNESTRRFLIDTLQNIHRTDHDIVIACAHSRTGYWVQELRPERQRIVLDTCDLVLSATTHAYGRQVIEGYETSGALCLNTGSVTYPLGGRPGGYVQVHVFGAGPSMLVQYVSVDIERRLPGPPTTAAYLKEIGGAISEVTLAAEGEGAGHERR